MKAIETRTGGRHVARERGSEERETPGMPEPAGEQQQPRRAPRGTRIVDRLDGQSLAEVAIILEDTVAGVAKRYGVDLDGEVD